MSLHSAFLANGKVQRESTPPRRLYVSPFRSPAPRPLLKSLPTEVASATDLGAPVGISIARSIDRSADSFTLSSQRVAQSLARSDRTRSEGKAFTAREITSDRRPHASFPLFSQSEMEERTAVYAVEHSYSLPTYYFAFFDLLSHFALRNSRMTGDEAIT